MPVTYRVKVVRGDFQLEAEGDKAFVQDMLKRFAGELPQSGAVPAQVIKKRPGSSQVEIQPSGKHLSVSEYIRTLGVKRHTDIVLAFGYYLEKFAGTAEFTPADINSCYYDAKMESSNTSQMIIQNIKRSLIMPAKKPKGEGKGKKAYVLTRTGEKFIEDKLSTPK